MLQFDELTHTYTLDGKELISVTQLMKKHGLAPDYSGVSEEVLNRAAERGTLIHKEIEDYCKTGEIGFTNEVAAFADYIEKSDYYIHKSETTVYNDVCAGTIDLLLEDGISKIIADIKTTAAINIDAVSWQLSIYAYLEHSMTGACFCAAQVFHFNKDGELKVIDVPFKPVEEIERLLQCERDGVLYQQDVTQIITNQQIAAIQEAERIIAEAEEAKKSAEARLSDIKAAIMAAMEKSAVKTVETDSLKITYILPSERTTIDSARLKKELPTIAEKYSKTSKTAASLRITIK